MLLLWAPALLLLNGCLAPRDGAVADLRLAAPQLEGERSYLGLPAGISRFSPDDIRAEILIVDFFDMYCPVCQKQAHHLNELYALVQNRALGERIKLIGVGVGDTPLEAATFKEKFRLPFPVFADRAGSFTKQFGAIKVPSVLALKRRSDRFQVVHHGAGIPPDPAELLSHILSDGAETMPHDRHDQLHTGLPTCRGGATECVQDPKHGAPAGFSFKSQSLIEPCPTSDDHSKE